MYNDPAGPVRIAIVHEWLVDLAGSELVLEQILQLFPEAVLYTLIDRMPAVDRTRLPSSRTVTSWLDRLPGIQHYFTHCLPVMPIAVQQFDLSGYDLVISSNHCVAKGVIVSPETLHLCYCHSPMRYAWDMQQTYLIGEGLSRGPLSWLARLIFYRLRLWDAYTANGVDHFAANSKFVRQRILKAYRRDAVVIHPPVSMRNADDIPAAERRGYVTVGRLMSYKNTALMVEAFRLLPNRQLTVAGGGPLLVRLRRNAPPNVRFVGPVSPAAKATLLQSAQAFIFAAIEDFGIAPLEALAAGTPVIALSRGGVLDYLVHGDNAWLYDDATPDALAKAVLESEKSWRRDVAARCTQVAAKFSEARFRHEFAAWVAGHWKNWRPPSAALP